MDELSDVITRMCGAYMSTINSQPEDCRDGSKAMLAAVREMVGAIQHDKRFVGMTCQLMDLIEDHERRSEGKGQGL